MAQKKITYREYDKLKVKCFLRFLKEKHIFGNYKNNRSKVLTSTIPNVKISDILRWSFPFYKAIEGVQFWNDVDCESKKLDFHFMLNINIIR